MITIILIIIYLAFISLGLPDSLLGSAWPVMQTDLSVNTSSAGIISMLICGGTIISSLFFILKPPNGVMPKPNTTMIN